MIIDSNKIPDKIIYSDVCIIGAGPAGITLANKLCNSNLDIVIADSGGRGFEKKPNELNSMIVQSNFKYRNGESNRNRQIGGTANLWAGRVVPFVFNPDFDAEWGQLTNLIKPHYDEAFQLLNIDPVIQHEHEHFDHELYGYWGIKTQRFNSVSRSFKKINYRIYTYLTLTGEPEFDGEQLSVLSFVNQNQEKIKISSHRFVFAMGGIENSRMLLIMSEQIKPRLGSNFKNVGKYIMDHPRVSHGSIVRQTKSTEITRFQMQATEYGIYKIGIRNKAMNTRAYCNIMGIPGRIAGKVGRLPVRSFQNSSKRLLLKEKGILRTLANQCRTLPFLKHSSYIRTPIIHFVNNKVSQKYRIMIYCEQRPRIENQIVLNNKTDRNNLRIPGLLNNIHPDELDEVLAFYKTLEIQMGNLGCKIDYYPEKIINTANYTDASHIMGGTRYSSDKTKAVVDAQLRVIGIPNLYISGSSVFPTAGVENPTHLIVSISCYLADVLKKDYHMGG